LLYRSTDAGAHWTFTPGSTVGAVTRIGFDPTDPNLVYMGSDGVYRSTDGGQTFSATTSVPVTALALLGAFAWRRRLRLFALAP
jgi:MYXO-CTERM domain-containing protein